MGQNEESENEENDNNENLKKKLRFSRRRKPRKKTKFSTKCPFCSEVNIIFIPAQQFQLKHTQCNDDECNEEYWVQIKDNVPLVTKQYPFKKLSINKKKKSDSHSIDSDVEIIQTPKKKRKISSPTTSTTTTTKREATTAKNDELTYCGFPIPALSKECEHEINDVSQFGEPSSFYNNVHCRPYESIQSHIEMLSGCSRSKCSDFIPGNFHCFEAAPVSLPGNIKMAEIGYNFDCIFCGKQVSYIENVSNEEKVTDGVLIETDSVEQQCHFIYNSLQNNSNFSADVPSYSRVPNSFNDLKIRDRIMASDGTNFLPAWIIKIDRNKKANMSKVLVHFKGWNSRWDKWYNINSGMLKTVNEYRKEKKMHSATRNETIYQVMKQTYPTFCASSLYEEEINKNDKKKKREKGKLKNDNVEIVDAEIVMMHDKNETFMALHELPIYKQNEMVLCPPLFYSASTMNGISNKNVAQIVRKCFVHLSQSLINEKDIQLLYEKCQSKIHCLFFTLYALKSPQRVKAFLKLLQSY